MPRGRDVIHGNFTCMDKPRKGFTWWYEEYGEEVVLVQRRITTLPKDAQKAYAKGKEDEFKAYKSCMTRRKKQLEKKIHDWLVADLARV